MLNLVQLQERLKGVPMQALMQYANGSNPQVPPFLALGELNRRKKMQEEASADQAQQMEGAPSIKDQIEQSAGLLALQGSRQRQAAQQQQAAQQTMPMAAPNTTTSEPAQMAGGGFVDDIVVPRDYQMGGQVQPQINPEMLKRLMMLKAMKQKPGLAGLQTRPDMFKRSDYAGGGIVAFAGPEGSFVESSPGFYQLAEEVPGQEQAPTDIKQLFAELIRKQQQRKSLAERLKEANLEQPPEPGREELMEIQRSIAEQKAQAPMDQLTAFLSGITKGRGGNWATQGARGAESAIELEAKQRAGMAALNQQMAKIKDLREKAKYESARGNITAAMADEDLADKAQADLISKMSEAGYKEKLGIKAEEGSNLDKVAAAIDLAKSNPTPENIRKAQSMIEASGYVTYAAPRVAATESATQSQNEREALQAYQRMFDPTKPLLGDIGREMRAAAAKDKGTGRTDNQDDIRLREYNRIRASLGLPTSPTLPGGPRQVAPTASSGGGFTGRELPTR